MTQLPVLKKHNSCSPLLDSFNPYQSSLARAWLPGTDVELITSRVPNSGANRDNWYALVGTLPRMYALGAGLETLRLHSKGVKITLLGGNGRSSVLRVLCAKYPQAGG